MLTETVREALSKNPDILGTMERVIAAGETPLPAEPTCFLPFMQIYPEPVAKEI